jgi:hypothetical protein
MAAVHIQTTLTLLTALLWQDMQFSNSRGRTLRSKNSNDSGVQSSCAIDLLEPINTKIITTRANPERSLFINIHLWLEARREFFGSGGSFFDDHRKTVFW